MGEFTSAEDAIAELYDAMASDPYDDTQDALRDHLQDARDRVLSELTALRAENARLRTGLDSMLRIFREETSSGDGIQEGHVAVYEAARAALDAKEG